MKSLIHLILTQVEVWLAITPSNIHLIKLFE